MDFASMVLANVEAQPPKSKGELMQRLAAVPAEQRQDILKTIADRSKNPTTMTFAQGLMQIPSLPSTPASGGGILGAPVPGVLSSTPGVKPSAPTSFEIRPEEALPPSTPRPAPVPEAPAPETPGVAPAAPAPAPGVPKELVAASPKALKVPTYNVANLASKIKEDESLTPEVREAFTIQLNALKDEMTAVRKDFADKWDNSQKEFKDEKSKLEWMQVSELVGNALLQAGAAFYGLQKMKETGLPINLSNLNLTASNWDGKMQNAIAELQQKRIAIAESQKEATEGIQTQMKELGEAEREYMKQVGADSRAKADRIARAEESAESRKLEKYKAELKAYEDALTRSANMAIARERAAGNKKGASDIRLFTELQKDLVQNWEKKSKESKFVQFRVLLSMGGKTEEEINEVIDQNTSIFGDSPEGVLPLLNQVSRDMYGSGPVTGSSAEVDVDSLPRL